MSELLDDVIIKYVKEAHESDSSSEIARRILDDNESSLSHRSLRRKISEYRSGGSEIESKVTPEDSYWVDSAEVYHISSKNKGTIKFPVKLIDKMFLDYSRHGYNLSSTQVIHKYDLKVEEWHLIKGRLRLFKESNIFSPWTVEHTPPEDLQEVIESQMNKLFRNKVITEKTYDKVIHREYKKAIQDRNFKELEITAFMDTIAEALPHLPPVELKYCDHERHDEFKEITVVIADLHVGAETDKMIRTPQFNLDILKARLHQVAKIVNDLEYDKVNINVLGDLIESFTGLSHKNSWKGLQKGMWGAQAVINAYEIFIDFFNEIVNFDKAYFVGGNHDRSTSDNKEDTTAEISNLICYMLSQAIGNDQINNFGDIGSYRQGGSLNIIPTHGHLGLSKQNGASMSWKYGIQGLFNLILQGHLHSRIIKPNDDGTDFRKIICPSIFSGNNYSEQGGWDGGSGFLTIEEMENGTPKITDYTL